MTQKTKELRNTLKKVALFAGITFCTVFGFRGTDTENVVLNANAATLQLHNYVTNDSYAYTGTQVTYYINGKKLNLDYPGVLSSDGSALGPCNEIFIDGLGFGSDYSEGITNFKLQYGTHTIQMTLGNSIAYVDGKKQFMPCAPTAFSFNGNTEKHLYVPTRFVAEACGFSYTWNSSTSTSSINYSNEIYDGNKMITYDDVTPSFFLNHKLVEVDSAPGYIFNDCVVFSAEHYFKQTGLASYSYNEGSGLILLQKDNVLVRLVLDSPVAYINDTPHLLKTVPRLIKPTSTSEPIVYIPALFVAEALGYQSHYIKITSNFYINGSLDASAEGTLTGAVSGSIVPDTATYGELLFSFEAHEQVVEHYTESGYQVPSLISGYSCINSDALYLQGIDYKSIKITDKHDVIEIEVNKCHNPFSGKYNYNASNSFLNYCYIFGTDNLRITIIKMKDLQYYSYAAPNGTVIHFTDTLGLYEDYIKFTGIPEVSEDTGLAGTDTSELLPNAVFNREYFVIPLPEGVTVNDISDSDDYGNKRFTIQISGNYMKFLSEQDVYNPVTTLKNYQVNYKLATDTTIITFNTTKIQGYSYIVSNGFLAVKIADPPEIYEKIIVLDAGHGGIDPGTSRGSLNEKTVNYNVVNVYAPEYFKNSDIKVYYTRTTDTKIALETRAAFAKSVGADLFISFHVNAHSSSSVNGTSVYYSTSNNTANASGLKSSTLASSLLKHMTAAWGTKNAGVLTAKFVVIHENTVPAALVECGFITNNNDYAKIKDATYQKKAAKALFDSVTAIFEQYPTNR